MKRVLLVEPDRLLAETYKRALSDNFEVHWVRTSRDAIATLDNKNKKFDVVLSETNLDQHNGIELLNELRAYEDWINLPVVFLSGLSEQHFPLDEAEWQQFGVRGFLFKGESRPSQINQWLVNLLNEPA